MEIIKKSNPLNSNRSDLQYGYTRISILSTLEENKVYYPKSELSRLDKFKSKNAEDRMKDIMILGDSGNPKAFELIEYGTLNDNDSGVVMAALKKLPNSKTNSGLSPLLEKLKSKKNINHIIL